MAAAAHAISVNWLRTGVAASLCYRVIRADTDAVLVARTNSGVGEVPAGSGLYRAAAVTWDDAVPVRVVWDDGTNWAEETIAPATGTYVIDGDDYEVR